MAAALMLYVVMATWGASRHSPTFDEPAHVAAGSAYWRFNDYRLQPENGNWPQRLAALPLLLDGTGFPSRDTPAWQGSDVWTVGDDLLYGSTADAARIMSSARFAITLLAAALGLVVFVWSRQLFGTTGGWISLSLFVFSPTMLAHGALATSDLMSAAFFTFAAWSIWRVSHRVTPVTVIASIVSCAGVFLSKFSAPILLPIAGLLIAVRLLSGIPVELVWRGRAMELRRTASRAVCYAALAVAHLAGIVLLVWASYGFRYAAFAPPVTGNEHLLVPWTQLLQQASVGTRTIEWTRAHHLLPEAYLYGLANTIYFAKQRASFFNGEFSATGGWLGFFPFLALAKATIPSLVLIAVGLLALISARLTRERQGMPAGDAGPVYAASPLLVLVAVYGAFALTSSLNIGHRHLLPIVPAMLILAGAAVRLQRTRRAGAWIIGILLTWHAAESAHIAPDYLAYFNEAVGGPSRAYRRVVDSSLDWGQDLPALARWLKSGAFGDGSPIYLSYFGSARPESYGITARPLPGFLDRLPAGQPQPLDPGVYCISATMLQTVYLSAPGPWTPAYETAYWATMDNLRVFDSTAADARMRTALLHQTGEEFWWRTFHTFEELRFARLAALLRQREPDHRIGYSILVYRVGAEELRRAQAGAMP